MDFEKHTVRFEAYEPDRKEWTPRPPPTRIIVREEINKGEDRGYETFLKSKSWFQFARLTRSTNT